MEAPVAADAAEVVVASLGAAEGAVAEAAEMAQGAEAAAAVEAAEGGAFPRTPARRRLETSTLAPPNRDADVAQQRRRRRPMKQRLGLGDVPIGLIANTLLEVDTERFPQHVREHLPRTSLDEIRERHV